MATWTLTATNLPINGGANGGLTAQIDLTGAQPADFNPDAITAIRLGRTLNISGVSDDNVDDNQDIALINSGGLSVAFAQGTPVNRAGVNGSWAYGPTAATITGDPPSATGMYLTAAGGSWANYNSNMKADGGVISITAVTVEIDYVPGAPPAASFTKDKTTVYTGQAIQFTDTSTQTPNQWSWDFGGGASASTQKNPLVTFNTPGVYDVRLTATNTFGQNTSAPQQITVLAREAEVWNGSAWVGGESWNGSAWVVPEVWDGVQWIPMKAP